MSCDAYRELLPAYLEDSLDEVRRTGFRSHVRDCPDCRAFVIAAEPTLALSFAERREPSADRIEACVTGVMAGIRQERLQRQLEPRRSRRPWLAAAAAVLIAVTAGSVWWISGGPTAQEPALQADAHEIELAEPVAADVPPQAVEPPPRVEIETTDEEVRVYQYAIGDDQNTGAVFIVNPSMEL